MKLIHQLLTYNQDFRVHIVQQHNHVTWLLGGSFTRDSLRLWTQSNIICNNIIVNLFYG